jgi:hypothetical protein
VTDSPTATALEMPNVAAMSPQQAAARLDELMRDEKWSAALTAGNGPQGQEFRSLMERKVATVDSKLEAVLVRGAEAAPLIPEVTYDGALNSTQLARVVANFREIGLNDETVRQAASGAPVSRAEYDAVKTLRGDMMADKDFVAAVLSGNPAAVREFTLMNTIVANGYVAEEAAP